jgi:hypothetical protein
MVQDDQYLLNFLQYMELSPVKARVKDPSNFTSSSYKSHAFGKSIDMWTRH